MSRGVFALTWFFLLSMTLIDLYAIHNTLVFSEITNQGTLMTVEELFYLGRNFEYSFKEAISLGDTDSFLDYWAPRGNISFGILVEFPKKHCVQTNFTFSEFLRLALIEHGNIILFSPIGVQQSCISLEVSNDGFKTYGVISSLTCINTSSSWFSC